MTERVFFNGPRTRPGLRIELARTAAGEAPTSLFEYVVRAGYIDSPRPFNHVRLDIGEDSAEQIIMRYMSALVAAWQPDHLGAVTPRTQEDQGHMPRQLTVGRLSCIRNGIPSNTKVLDEQVDIVEADGGSYIRVPGTLQYAQSRTHPPGP